MYIQFKFPNVTKVFSVNCRQQTLSENKDALYVFLFTNGKILKEILAITEREIQKEGFSDIEKDILRSVVEKLKIKVEIHESQEQDQEFDHSRHEFTDNETNLMISSIEFIVNGEILDEKKENAPLTDLNIAKNPNVVINYNLRRGFDHKSVVVDEPINCDKTIPELFKCKIHKNEKCTHFCRECNKLICAFDFVSSGNEIGCAKHADKVISVSEYQVEMENLMNQKMRELNMINNEIVEINNGLETESNELQAKKESNIKNSNKIKETVSEIEKIAAMKNGNEKDSILNYFKLEKILKILPVSKELIETIIIQKNEQLFVLRKELNAATVELHSYKTELDKKVEEAKKSIDEKHKQEILNVETAKNAEISKRDEEIKQKNEAISKNNEIIAAKDEEILIKNIEINSKRKKLEKKQQLVEEKEAEIAKKEQCIKTLEGRIGGVKKLIESIKPTAEIKNLLANPPIYVPKKVINVAILANDTGRTQDVEMHLSSLNRFGLSIRVTVTKQILETDAKSAMESTDWQDSIDVFFIWSCDSPGFPNWCGNFLDRQLKLGKGIVICYKATQNDALGVTGGIASEMPFLKGDGTWSEGSIKILKIANSHPIMDDVKSFNGGKYSERAKIKLHPDVLNSTPNQVKNSSQVSLVAVWDDGVQTPLIIAKNYTDEKINYGNIVVSNFYPPSSNVCGGWDATTDGDKLLQNAVCWAGKFFPGQKTPAQLEEEKVRTQRQLIEEEKEKLMIKKIESESKKFWETFKENILKDNAFSL